jgi:predicted DNA-binding protein
MVDTPRRKAMTLRLDTETADQLEALAQVEGVPVSEVVREALAHHIEQRRADAEFQKRLHESIERNQAILKRLAT